MKILSKLLIILIISTITLQKIKKKVKKEKATKNRKLEGSENSNSDSEEVSGEIDTTKIQNKDAVFCQNELLYSFGILNSGHVNEKSLLCANAEKESCCSATSEKLILNFWKNNNKYRIKQYLEGYIYLFKKILNFYENYLAKAKKIHSFPSSPPECKEASSDLISYFQNRSILTNYFLKLEKTFQHLGFVRKSFYCVLCTVDTQSFFDIENKNIIFANKFCENLVESTISEFYNRNSKYMRILNNMNILTNCEPNKPYNPDVYHIDMALDNEDDISLTKCYQVYNKDQDPRVFVPECLDYCGKFSMTSAKEIFEGSFGKLYYLYNKIKAKRIKAKNPVFKDIDMTKEFDFSHIGIDFFESNLKGFDLNGFENVFERNGIELFYISAKTKLVFGEGGGNGLGAGVFRWSITSFFLLFYYLC